MSKNYTHTSFIQPLTSDAYIEEIALDLDPKGVGHGDGGEVAVFPGGSKGVAGQGNFAFENMGVWMDVDAFPDGIQHPLLILCQNCF